VQITFLGHAGFLVETADVVVVVDPWLSPTGAFDSAWMQLPKNHHLAPLVRQKLADRSRARFLYLSHEHGDHFDPEFLGSLAADDVPVVVPRFRPIALQTMLLALGFRDVRALSDGQRLALPGGYLRLFVQEVGLNRDSALLLRLAGRTFLDLNDCKIHDRLSRLRAEEGPIDVFTAQFSGAVWHPTCYEYDRADYEAICRKKVASKFEAVGRGIHALRPRAFVASAGPPCFLDPILLEKNFEPVNIFPRAPAFFRWLRDRPDMAATALHEPMPGDVLDVESNRLHKLGIERISDETFEAYVRAYASEMRHLFLGRGRNLVREEVDELVERLGAELWLKLEEFPLHHRIKMPLYVRLAERPDRMLRVDFANARVEVTGSIQDGSFCTLEIRACDAARVLDQRISWEGLLLSMRTRLSRTPDVYDPMLYGFIAGEREDLRAYCDEISSSIARVERVVVEVGERRYRINRFCPHQGADLSKAWVEDGRYLVCPRHRWTFDLENGGKCTSSACSIEARPFLREADCDREVCLPLAAEAIG
jgi:UDP-MurNAc hydroxylase